MTMEQASISLAVKLINLEYQNNNQKLTQTLTDPNPII